jgi:hypothetical protein
MDGSFSHDRKEPIAAQAVQGSCPGIEMAGFAKPGAPSYPGQD